MNVVTVVGQLLIIFFGGSALSTVRLDGTQWIISLFLGAMSLVIGVLARLVPDSWVISLVSQFSGWHRAETHEQSLAEQRQQLDESTPLLGDTHNSRLPTRYRDSVEAQHHQVWPFRSRSGSRPHVDIESA